MSFGELHSKLTSCFPPYLSSLSEQPQPRLLKFRLFFFQLRNLVLLLKGCLIKKTMHLYVQGPNLDQRQLILRPLARLSIFIKHLVP